MYNIYPAKWNGPRAAGPIQARPAQSAITPVRAVCLQWLPGFVPSVEHRVQRVNKRVQPHLGQRQNRPPANLRSWDTVGQPRSTERPQLSLRNGRFRPRFRGSRFAGRSSREEPVELQSGKSREQELANKVVQRAVVKV